MFVAIMRAVSRATEIWLLLALVSLGCVLLGGAHGYQDAYWLFTIGCWAVLDICWALAARQTKPVSAGRQKWTTLLVTFLIYALYCLPLSSIPLLGQRVLPRFMALQTLGALMCAF